MKKLAMLVCCLFAVSAIAAPRENVGVGVGTLIFEGQDGLVSQVLAVTTNGILGNQTFAITSGTLGAERPDALVQHDTLKKFVAENMASVAKDIATGEGESLDTIAELLAIPQEQRAAFAQSLQSKFGEIYSSDDVTDSEVVRGILAVANS